MRLLTLTVAGIGGLTDGRVVLPDGPIAAFAGANGTGKSKLLACLLAPWTSALPPTRPDMAAEIRVEVSLTEAERAAIDELSRVTQAGQIETPEHVEFVVRFEPLAGIQRSSVPNHAILHHFFFNAEFMRQVPSLDVLYLPAERRLLTSNQSGVDLSVLSDLMSFQKISESRSTATYGYLDDQEFEQFAKALSVAHHLPPDPKGQEPDDEWASHVTWDSFKTTVDALIAPKTLVGLTRGRPDQLLIETSDGQRHLVPALSSGERQALVIISRVLRAGVGHRVVIIDEPDAYLHPHLSQRLIQALQEGVGPNGQLIVATHSPAILDISSPTAIVRLRHNDLPRRVVDESDRIELYRAAGFRASALTQADLLVFTEGDTDVTLLGLLVPELSRAGMRSVGGRVHVLRQVEQLSPYEIPVLGVVDRDVWSAAVPTELASQVSVWPTADIEGAFLSEDAVLEEMIERGLIKAGRRTVTDLRSELDSLVLAQKDNVVAELAQRILREKPGPEWPSPKGDDPLARLRAIATNFEAVDAAAIDAAIAEAERIWDKTQDRWTIVRAKPIVNTFASRVSTMRAGQDLLEAVARAHVTVPALGEFETRVQAAL